MPSLFLNAEFAHVSLTSLLRFCAAGARSNSFSRVFYSCSAGRPSDRSSCDSHAHGTCPRGCNQHRQTRMMPGQAATDRPASRPPRWLQCPPGYAPNRLNDRLIDVLLLTPNAYNFTVGQLFLSALGRAVALDESVNRPSNVVKNLKKALDKFFILNPSVSKDVSTWGSNHATYELKVVEIYGPGRVGMTEPADRYNKIKGALSV